MVGEMVGAICPTRSAISIARLAIVGVKLNDGEYFIIDLDVQKIPDSGRTGDLVRAIVAKLDDLIFKPPTKRG